MLRIPNFLATFNADGTILSTGPAAKDTLVRVSNESSTPRIAHVSFWNEHEDLAFDLNIALKGRDSQSYSVASLLRGVDSRALPCPHAPDQPRYCGGAPYPAAYLFQHLCWLSHGYRSRTPVDGVIRNPIHGYIIIDDLHSNGTESTLRAEYFIGRLDSLPKFDARLVEETLVDSVPVVYSRASRRGLGVVIEESQMKVREAIRLIESDGWIWVATRGSHRQYKHPEKPGRVTIPGNLNDDLAPGTFNSILKQAGLKP